MSSKSLPLPTQEHCVLSEPHTGAITVVRFSHGDGDYLISGSVDRSIQLWNPAKSKHIKSFSSQHGREINDLQLNANNTKMISASSDKTAIVWDVSTGEVVRRLRGHTGGIFSVGLGASDDILATASYDQTVRLWDVRAFSKDPVQIFRDAKDSIMSVRIHDTCIASCSMDGCLRRYEIRTAQLVTDTIATPLTSLCWSHDGNCILLSALDSTLKLMDIESGTLLNEYTGNVSTQYKMESLFDNSDGYVIGGGEDGIIRVWDLVEAGKVHQYEGHKGAILSLDWHPKEKKFASGSADGTIRYWL